MRFVDTHYTILGANLLEKFLGARRERRPCARAGGSCRMRGMEKQPASEAYRQTVSDIRPNVRFDGWLLVKEATPRTTANGKKFLDLALVDRQRDAVERQLPPVALHEINDLYHMRHGIVLLLIESSV